MLTTASNGAGGSFRAPFENGTATARTGRKTFDLRLSKEFNVGGSKRIVALAEAFNLSSTGATTPVPDIRIPEYRVTHVYDPRNQQGHDDPDRRYRLPRPTAASNTLSDHATRSSGSSSSGNPEDLSGTTKGPSGFSRTALFFSVCSASSASSVFRVFRVPCLP